MRVVKGAGKDGLHRLKEQRQDSEGVFGWEDGYAYRVALLQAKSSSRHRFPSGQFGQVSDCGGGCSVAAPLGTVCECVIIVATLLAEGIAQHLICVW